LKKDKKKRLRRLLIRLSERGIMMKRKGRAGLGKKKETTAKGGLGEEESSSGSAKPRIGFSR